MDVASKRGIYLLTIGPLGMMALGWAAWHVAVQPPHAAWLLLAALALLGGRSSTRLPSDAVSVSAADGVLLGAAVLFGPAVATIVAAIDGLAVSLRGRNQSTSQTVFDVGAPAISVYAASLLFYRLARVPPFFRHAEPVASLLWPLLVLAVTYFTLTTLLAGVAVWLDTGESPLDVLGRHVPSLAVDLSICLSVAVAVVLTSASPTASVLAVLAPMLVALYISSRRSAGRLADTSRDLSELRRVYDSTVETLALAIDARDQGTHGHIRRVQLLSTAIARALGASERDVRALEAAALLYDLGKVAVPEHILNKPGSLTPGEYAQVKEHADIGASILSAIDFPFPVAPIVRHHHENWDGTGYPDGLSGRDIPLGARILAVADCYDALTSGPYRRRMTHRDAIAILRCWSGRMYDPEVVDAFERVHTGADLTQAPARRFPVLRRGPASPVKPATDPICSAAGSVSPVTQRARIAQLATTLP